MGCLEAETHKLKIGLNWVGKAFVDLEEFYRSGLAPKEHEIPYREGDTMDDEEYDEWAFQRALERDES